MSKRLSYFLVLVGAALVLYLSWIPVPRMGLVWFIPHGLAHWADENRNDDLRTAVPLVPLGLLVGGQLLRQNRPWAQWLLAWAGLSLLVLVAEVGQFFLAQRSFSWLDVLWGAAGALAGLSLLAVVRLVSLLVSSKGGRA
ncbi:MAG: VanZ family protein [Janthinobacterium lividum]